MTREPDDGAPPAGGFVLYDGECGPCTEIARRLEAADGRGRFRFLPSQGEAATFLIDEHDLAKVVPHTLVLIEGGRIYKRSVAVHRILRGLGGRRRITGWLLWLVPWPVRELGYVIVAKNRWLLKPFVR